MRKYLNKTELIAGDFGQGFALTVFSHFSTKTNKAHLLVNSRRVILKKDNS